MAKNARATLALSNFGVKFTLHTYDYDPVAERIGLQAADALGVEPRRVLKTLMADVDRKPLHHRAVGSRSRHEKTRRRVRGKSAGMMPPADAERLTGYHVGGISPFAQKKRVPIAIEQTALRETASTSTADRAGCRSRSIRTMRSVCLGRS
jgi:Cys-tRNA(Pro)/Cys-tRNA(Cys) deacylase